MGCDPVTQTIKQSQSACHPKLAPRCVPFLVWWATTGGSSRGLHALHSNLVNIWLEKGPEGSQSGCHFQKMPWRLSKHWSRHVWQLLFWLFSDYTKLFLLETDASKEGLEAVLSQKQADGQYHPITYGSRVFMPCTKNYHSTKLEFLALKFAVTKHFKEYLPYQSFLVRMKNSPLTYIMMTPNPDVMGHQWVGALVQFNFELEYQKGHD